MKLVHLTIDHERQVLRLDFKTVWGEIYEHTIVTRAVDYRNYNGFNGSTLVLIIIWKY